MGALIVGLIGFICIVAAVAIPIWLEKNAQPGIPLISAPAPMPVMVILGIFTSAGLNMTFQVSESGFHNGAEGAALLLTLVAIASALFGRGAVSRKLRFGSYLGYVTSAAAAMLLLWTAIGGSSRSIEDLSWIFFVVFTLALIVSWAVADNNSRYKDIT